MKCSKRNGDGEVNSDGIRVLCRKCMGTGEELDQDMLRIVRNHRGLMFAIAAGGSEVWE